MAIYKCKIKDSDQHPMDVEASTPIQAASYYVRELTAGGYIVGGGKTKVSTRRAGITTNDVQFKERCYSVFIGARGRVFVNACVKL